MRPCLDRLADSLTLRILEELDFQGLAVVKRVSRRFHRIAADPSLFRRVSRVWWRHPHHFETDCPQLGILQLGDGCLTDRSAMFLVILERLLKGGAKASLISISTPPCMDGDDVLTALPTLLTKHDVCLKALSFADLWPSFRELLRSQPGLTNLCVEGHLRALLHRRPLPSIMPSLLPSLRHLVILEGMPQDIIWVEKLASQLRSFILHEGAVALDWYLEVLQRLVGVEGSGLLFRAVGGHGWRTMAFAVEDFRPEERGAAFLIREHWGEAEHRIPQPTRDPDIARRFVDALPDQ